MLAGSLLERNAQGGRALSKSAKINVLNEPNPGKPLKVTIRLFHQIEGQNPALWSPIVADLALFQAIKRILQPLITTFEKNSVLYEVDIRLETLSNHEKLHCKSLLDHYR